MTMAAQSPEMIARTAAEQWIRMYRKMVSIRLFEEQVNELYTRALMPGLAHLYTGEEAVAVGICEALRPDGRAPRGAARCSAHPLIPAKHPSPDSWDRPASAPQGIRN